MERIAQSTAISIIVKESEGFDDCIRIQQDSMDGRIDFILIEKQSIHALIDALKKYQE